MSPWSTSRTTAPPSTRRTWQPNRASPPSPRATPLAGRDGLSLADLGLRADEAHRYIDEVRGKGQDLAQLLTLVGLGDLVALLPASVADRCPRPGVVCRSVADAPPAVRAVVWPQQSRSTAAAALVRAAVRVADEVRERAAG
ncbi:LysR substrate-binding domain-containing protein OS=Streptomyces aurantiogriseus OX=66870 GN=GCM10010251_58250 PE=4 SV=1 [Streptomyces aurantiogriseus]|uniref:LysR substrate-binding domain-containing protein n=1 Tax=Streptomyces aurantiogriseus TaxID=66870 RepID=A0A918CP69_9ACTN|nr:hypothetical protein GCM10010251_58250 [Streptomyces aurantiogriseus]